MTNNVGSTFSLGDPIPRSAISIEQDNLELVTLRAASHTRLNARDHYNSSTLISGKGGASPSSLHTALEGLTEYMNGCKVYIYSYMALNGSCFMVTWTIFNNHLLEIGLTQNWETMTLRTLTTVDLF